MPRFLKWAVLLLLLMPVWLSGWLPTTDFTNHLARCWIFSKLPADPFWAEQYRLNNPLAPNTLIDLLASPLFSVIPAETVGRLIMSLIVFLHWAGVRVLARKADTDGWLTLIPLFFVYNSLYYMGFASYCLSITLTVLVVSFWIAVPTPARWRTVVSLLVLGTATYLSHLGGVFCIATSAAFLALWDLCTGRLDRWKLAYYGLPFLPAALMYAVWPPAALASTPLRWDGLSSKLLKSMSLFTGYDYRMDALVVILFAAGIVLAWRAGLQWNARLCSLGLLFLFFFAAFPYSLASGSDAYTRFIIPAGVFLFAAVRLRPGPGWRTAALVLLGVMVLKLGLLTGSWITLGLEARRQLALLDMVETHSILLPLVYGPESTIAQKRERHLSNLPTAVAYRREAMAVTTFAVTGQHSLSLRHSFGLRPGVDDTLGWGRVPPEYRVQPSLIDFRHVFCTFDYVYTWRLPSEVHTRILQYGKVVGTSGEGRLYRRRY